MYMLTPYIKEGTESYRPSFRLFSRMLLCSAASATLRQTMTTTTTIHDTIKHYHMLPKSAGTSPGSALRWGTTLTRRTARTASSAPTVSYSPRVPSGAAQMTWAWSGPGGFSSGPSPPQLPRVSWILLVVCILLRRLGSSSCSVFLVVR